MMYQIYTRDRLIVNDRKCMRGTGTKLCYFFSLQLIETTVYISHYSNLTNSGILRTSRIYI